jgi:short-subunit dehydrogenase involved in D-alanine esterification of teichoic acids
VYVEFTAVVRRQKEILKKLVERKQAEIRKVHPGLTCFRYLPARYIPYTYCTKGTCG